MGASGTEFDAEYGADQIQILEGLGSSKKKTRNVYWKHLCQEDSIIWYMRSWTMRWMRHWQDIAIQICCGYQ